MRKKTGVNGLDIRFKKFKKLKIGFYGFTVELVGPVHSYSNFQYKLNQTNVRFLVQLASLVQFFLTLVEVNLEIQRILQKVRRTTKFKTATTEDGLVVDKKEEEAIPPLVLMANVRWVIMPDLLSIGRNQVLIDGKLLTTLRSSLTSFRYYKTTCNLTGYETRILITHRKFFGSV